jgi:D-3-phosphoglycerate dehydrogenase
MRAPLVKVTSPSFSRDPDLRAALSARFRRVTFNETGGPLAADGLVRFLADADAAVVGLERVDEALLARTPRLRVIAKYGVGLDNIDGAACERHGVTVGWTAGVNALSVAELTLTLMLSLMNQAFRRAAELRAGAWNKRGGVLLSGRTVGVVGLGHVGREVMRLLRPFGCRVLGNDVVDRSAWCAAEGVVPADKETIWRTADVVTLHVPLTAETRHLVDERVLACMRPEAVLINTSRGAVVDQNALEQALAAGRIAGAALDVFAAEPLIDAGLLALPNLICTPHIGGASREAVLAMGRAAIAHLEAFFATRHDERISA